MTGRLRSRSRDGQQAGFRRGAGVGVDRLPVGDAKLSAAASPARRRRFADAIAPSIRAVRSCSNAVNRMFCRSMVSASSRLRKVVIGGSSSLMPLLSVSLSPVASSNVLSEQPSTLPQTSRT